MKKENSLLQVINTCLLILIVLSMVLNMSLKDESMTVVYLEVAFTGLFVLLNILKVVLKVDWLTYLLLFAFIVHYATTSDKPTTIIIMIITVLFYEALKWTNVNMNWTMTVVFLVFFVSYIMSIGDMYVSLTTNHTNRELLYKGFFVNSNTNAGFSLFTFFFTILFCKKTVIRYVIFVLTLSSMLASGSRNAIICVAMFAFFILIQKTFLKKYTFLSFVGVMILAFCYLFFVEIYSSVDFTVMGKEANSAGRSEQITLVMLRYPLTLFGVGKDAIDAFSFATTGYAVHNAFINSLYSMGVVIMLCYMLFIYRIYQQLDSIVAKSALLASNVYFFFDPGVMFYLLLINVYPIMIVLLKMNEERKERVLQIKKRIQNVDTQSDSLLLVWRQSSARTSRQVHSVLEALLARVRDKRMERE